VSWASETVARPQRALQIETIARYTVWIILAYFAAQLSFRLGLSGNLKTDEAQFVGHTAFALSYGNSHPPLYNWLVAGVLALTGSWAAATVTVKMTFLTGTYLIFYDIGRRLTGQHLTGLIAAASLLFLPQIVWKSQVTLAHSVMVMFAVTATLHAIVLVYQRGRQSDFLWLGLAVTIGAYAKYNFFMGFAALLLAAYAEPEIRKRLFRPSLAISGGVFALLYGPHMLWLFNNIMNATERLGKLQREHPVFSLVDVPVLGIDGLIALIVAIVAWLGPLVVTWFVILRFTPAEAEPDNDHQRRIFASFFRRVTLLGIGLFALIVLFGNFDDVHERYLTPLLMAFPLWLVMAMPLEARRQAPVHFLRVSGIIVVLMLTAWPAWILLGREQLAFPYDRFAAEISAVADQDFALTADRHKVAANLLVRMDGARLWPAHEASRVIAVWRGHSSDMSHRMKRELGARYQPAGPIIKLSRKYHNLSGETARISFRLYKRSP